jgi:hypothetical protein
LIIDSSLGAPPAAGFDEHRAADAAQPAAPGLGAALLGVLHSPRASASSSSPGGSPLS